MTHDYENPWGYRLKWLYMLTVVGVLMLPVFYTLYISFNYGGFGAAEYEFTWLWYRTLFENQEIRTTLGWTALIAVIVVACTIPLALLAAKFYQRTRFKVPFVFLMLMPLFVPADVTAAALLVYFKNLNTLTESVLGLAMFELSLWTAVIGQITWCLPYAFVVILVTMARFRPEQAEAARTCGANAWQAFWHVEFPQIRAGVFASTAFVAILSFNEYVRTNFLKGGFDTFPTYLVSYMLNTGMTPEVYAMAGLFTVVSMSVVIVVLATTMLRERS
ncbi:spermidine/purescine ABC transporter permease [Thalassobaculum fulvum]|jgi:ABC-type spermidine/putrescine transport system permease subunit II|uniref:Spermidine/purescine ABC transporter permease n=1 Tax=Thalassobaculum fulvum TaxID=1633335 RepID=A0A919CRR0_9PROT|nr:ABC transporter permease [Thalassobaculum fulvum]GHD60408.1 spermidine/purescine ABC transporter permease [Thalassobaculum fulvum]